MMSAKHLDVARVSASEFDKMARDFAHASTRDAEEIVKEYDLDLVFGPPHLKAPGQSSSKFMEEVMYQSFYRSVGRHMAISPDSAAEPPHQSSASFD